MNRFALPPFDPEQVELVCKNVDCPGRKGEVAAVRFFARAAGCVAGDDGEEIVLENQECPYCGTEGSKP